MEISNADLIFVWSNHDDGSFRSVTCDRTEPEIQPRVFPAEPDVPTQEIYRSIRQEKLQNNNRSVALYYYSDKGIPPRLFKWITYFTIYFDVCLYFLCLVPSDFLDST